MASVCFRNVSKVYPGEISAIRDLSLSVRDGELLVLLGPSGSGKTTLLRLVAGLESVSAGEIEMNGVPVTRLAPSERNVAMVFQAHALHSHLTVFENLALGLDLRYGGSCLHRTWKRLTSPAVAAQWATERRGIRERVRQTAKVLRIEHLLDRKPRRLSGGEQQRVALGRAMVRHPAVFLFDEPLSSLDAPLRLELRRELKTLHQRLKSTMIHVTHDQQEAMSLGDRIAVLRDGVVQQVGEPRQLRAWPANRFVADFISVPPMNLLAGRLVPNGGAVDFACRGWRWRDLGGLGWRRANESISRTSHAWEIVLGVSAESVALRCVSTEQRTSAEHAGPTEQPGHSIGVVTDVERLGGGSLAGVRPLAAVDGNDPQPILAWSSTERRVGERVQVQLDFTRCHWFDPTTGANLDGPAPPASSDAEASRELPPNRPQPGRLEKNGRLSDSG